MITQRAGDPDVAKRHQHSAGRGDEVAPGIVDGDPASMLRELCICSVGELFGGVERHLLGMLSALAIRGRNPCSYCSMTANLRPAPVRSGPI